ncbi:MAG: hypothetical protein NZ528_17395 [Caldilineales bacterium]|nr:hypothetical protein [Caldilineales bacterium]MDW8316720.1 hypothetical protein [Anaerolineae bacterium]
MTEPWQTRASQFHPYVVDSLEKLPDALQPGALAALPEGDHFVRALVVPADYRPRGEGVSAFQPEQALIYTDHGVLHVQAPLEGEAAPQPTYLKPESLLLLRSSHILLYGRLKLLGAVHGQLAHIEMEFNAIGWRLMDAEWRRLVTQAIGVPELSPEEVEAANRRNMERVREVPSKFAEGLRRYGLYTGESLLGVVFQEGVWTESLSFFNHQLTPNTLLALTNASVLILAENLALVRKSEQYGLIITRIPRQVVAALQSVTKDSLQNITFYLARGGATAQRQLLLEPNAAQEWLELWTKHASQAQPG